MRRWRGSLVLAAICVIVLFCSASGAAEEISAGIYIDGIQILLDVQPQYEGNDYLMVPVRAIAEHLGAEVSWDEEAQSVTLYTPKGVFGFTVGSNRMRWNDETVVMRIPCQMAGDRTLIYYRSLEDCFYVHTEWDRENGKVTIITDNSLYDVQQKGEIVMGSACISPPLGFVDENGQHAGFEIDLAQEVAERLGVQLSVRRVSSARRLKELKDGQVDMLWDGLPVTEETEAEVLFSEPYITDGYVLVTKSETQITYKEELAQSRIGYIPGCPADDFFAQIQGATYSRYPDEKALLQALDAGKIDAFLARKIDAQYNITKDAREYKLPDFLYEKEDLAVAFAPDAIYLRNAVQDAIDQMKRDGTYAEILAKWFGEDRVDYIAYDEEANIVYNGEVYRSSEAEGWQASEVGERLGAVAQWGDDIKFFHLFMEIEAGVFAVKGSGGAALYVQPLHSEFDVLYLRSDIAIPEISAENISRIELTQGYMGYDHVNCTYGTTDKEVIRSFIQLLLNGESAHINPPYGSNETVLLYSDALPGCIYPILLYEKEGTKFLDFEGRLYPVSEALLEQLGAVHEY